MEKSLGSITLQLNVMEIDLNSTTSNYSGRNEDLAKAEIAIQSVILFLAIFGNICVLIALARGRKVRSRMHMFIMHLSIADLLVAFFNVLPQLIWEVTFRFEGGDFLCRFVKYMQIFVMYLSTYVLVMTAIDRYRAICHPLSTHTWTNKTANFMVIGAYVISGILSFPQILLFKYQETQPGSDEMDCWVHFDPPWILEVYVIAFTITVYFIPLVILIFSYGAICYTIWRKHRFTQTNVAKKEENGVKCQLVYEVDSYSTCNTGSGNQKKDKTNRKRNHTTKSNPYPRTHSAKGFSRAKLKTIKLTFVVILAYIVCWSPFFIAQFWWLFDETAADNDALVIMIILASLNSCCNPWIYLAFSGNLLKHLLPCCNQVDHSKHNQTWSHSNTDTRHKSIEMDRFNTRTTIVKRMESFSQLFAMKKKDRTSDASPQRSIQSDRSSSKSDENSRSPHVKKRARVHERPVEEVREAQLKWDQNIGLKAGSGTLNPGMPLITDISDDECCVKQDI